MAIWAISSVGRAPRLHRGCRRFEPVIAHHSLNQTLFFDFFTKGDALITSSTNYTIRVVIDDGTGMTRLMLEVD